MLLGTWPGQPVYQGHEAPLRRERLYHGQAVDARVHTNPVLENRFTLRLVAVPPRVGLYRALADEDR